MACIVKKPRLPRYSERTGWRGGDSKTLYAFTDKRTGTTSVRPGESAAGIGSEATVRVAKRSEAEQKWQAPLHAGWKVECD